MYIRFLTYDLNSVDPEHYENLYELIDYYGGERITESTFRIRSRDDWTTFKNNFRRVTHEGDIVKAIVLYNNGMKVWSIR